MPSEARNLFAASEPNAADPAPRGGVSHVRPGDRQAPDHDELHMDSTDPLAAPMPTHRRVRLPRESAAQSQFFQSVRATIEWLGGVGPSVRAMPPASGTAQGATRQQRACRVRLPTEGRPKVQARPASVPEPQVAWTVSARALAVPLLISLRVPAVPERAIRRADAALSCVARLTIDQVSTGDPPAPCSAAPTPHGDGQTRRGTARWRSDSTAQRPRFTPIASRGGA